MLEKLIAILAPHHCLACGDEGHVLCDWCLPDFAAPLPERCYKCKVASAESRVCQRCRPKTRLKHVWARTAYDDQPKRLIHEFKFERKRAAAGPIACLMAERLPYLPRGTIVTHVPTATRRVRQRGYDPAELIAKALAAELGLRHHTLLLRLTQTRQVGAKRAKRIEQMERAFLALPSEPLGRAAVLLVDDLTTTGATLESAAKCLRLAGAKTVSAAVFAQK